MNTSTEASDIPAPFVVGIYPMNGRLKVGLQPLDYETDPSLFYEYRLEGQDWKIFDPVLADNLKKGQDIRYKKGTYVLDHHTGEIAEIREVSVSDAGPLHIEREFTISFKVKANKGLSCFGFLLKDGQDKDLAGFYLNRSDEKEYAEMKLYDRGEGAEALILASLGVKEIPEVSHVALTWSPESEDRLRFYLNGELKAAEKASVLNSSARIKLIDLDSVRNVFGLTAEESGPFPTGDITLTDRTLSEIEIKSINRSSGVTPYLIAGLVNGNRYGVRFRQGNSRFKSPATSLHYAIPFNREEQILVEDYRSRFDGDETRMIDQALRDGQRDGKQILFADREYRYHGHFHLSSGDFDLKGIPGATEIINTQNWFDFTSDGFTKIFGICFNGNRQRPRVNRIRNSTGVFQFEKCTFKGGWQTKESGLAASLSVENDPVSVLLIDCVISDSNSEKPSGVRGNNPVCRGLYLNTRSGVFRMEGGEISRVGDKVTDRNGVSIWDERGSHGGGLGWHDLDGFVIQSSGGVDNNREIYLKRVAFSECRKRFIKSNNNPKNIYIEDCLFHIKEGRRCNQPVVFQQDFENGRNYNGHLTGCTFRVEKSEDFDFAGIGSAIVQLDGNGPEDFFLVKNNRLIVADSNETPEGWNCMFCIRTQGSGVAANITIEGNTADVPGGITYFIIMRPDAHTSPERARRNGIHNLIVKNNRIGKITSEPLRLGTPRNRDCDMCRVYTYYQMVLEKNSYISAPGAGSYQDGDMSVAGGCSECNDGDRNKQYLMEIEVK